MIYEKLSQIFLKCYFVMMDITSAHLVRSILFFAAVIQLLDHKQTTGESPVV